jgi:hypothetical protein
VLLLPEATPSASYLKALYKYPQEEQQPEWLFTENETNAAKLYHDQSPSPYVKDAFHEYLINNGNKEQRQYRRRQPEHFGTKAAAHYVVEVPAGAS